MSTQITYKGSTIASFSNDTKTLNTAGKYMEGDVAVTESISLQSKSVIPTTTSQTITADSGYEGLGTVTVGAVDNSATTIWDEEDSHGGTIRHIETGNVVSGITNITTNGLHTVASFYSASVNVVPNLQSKSITPSETVQTVTPDSNYDGLSQVSVGAISSTYVGSDIPQRSSSDLTTSGATVNVPSGYYDDNASKTISSGSATTPTTTITANPSISVNASGLITATTSTSKSITPSITAGYVASGTAGTVSVSGSNTSQLSTQGAATITPTESEQTAVASGKYTTGVVKVGAISSTYVGSGIDRNDSTDLTVSGATVTVPSGYYSAQASKSVASGTTGTPTATKGTVSNHSVSVTPSVTNTTGYITGGTKTGTAVTVSASELVSGTKSITENGTGIDVTNYASVDVEVPGSLNTYIIELTNSGSAYDYIAYNNVQYYTAGDIIEVNEGDIVTVSVSSGYESNSIYLNDTVVKTSFHVVSYNYTATSNVKVSFSYSTDVAKAYLSEVSDVVPLSITENGTYTASGATRGYSPVTVSVPSPSGTYNITSNGIYDVTNFASVNVSIDDSGFVWQDQDGYINLSEGRGGGLTVDDIAMRTISGDIAGNATYISSYAFQYCSNLTTANFPNATSIDSHAFKYCSSLTTVSFPEATIIDQYAFHCCSSLTTASFPKVTTINNYAFYSCRNLVAISFPKTTIINTYAFAYCSSLTTASFPSVTTISSSAFYGCSRLTTASFPSAISIGSYAFNNCSRLTTVSFPNVTNIGTSAFAFCYSLSTISFPLVTSIGGSTFRQCYNLLSLYLLGSSLCTNGGTATFTSTPIAGYTASTGGVYGSIFVPASLYNSYITAANWSALSSRFVSLTDAEIEALSN